MDTGVGQTPTVAVINGLQDTIEMLRLTLEGRGFRVVEAQARDVRTGNVNLATFVREERVDIVLYDVAIPYEANWDYLRRIRQSDALRNVPFVVTTTNQRALEAFVGSAEVIEIIGKPYDLARVAEAVERAIHGDAHQRRGAN